MPTSTQNLPRVAVVGAGAFGGWPALELLRRGARVTVVDAWGPGNPRASSGGETRVIRATYGSHAVYTRMAARAQALWRAHEARHGIELMRVTGALWMFAREDPFIAASAAALADEGLAFEELNPSDARRRFPQIDFTGIASVYLEPGAGYLRARDACVHVVRCFVAEGGTYLQGQVQAPVVDGAVRALTLADGRTIEADAFVFAAGPWMGSLFPELVGSHLTVTRQEVYYFGTPAGDGRFAEEDLPVWLDFGGRFIYGIPGPAGGGFKVADDTPGPSIDPTAGDRTPDPAGVAAMRAFVTRRFPALAGAPLIRSEICQYESTPDSNFILDRHPRAPNVVLAGGGSGHGFKMGPVVGELVARLVLDGAEPDPEFRLSRFTSPPAGGWKAKWG